MPLTNILLVEDNEGDILLAREAIDDLSMEVELNVVKDGEKAIEYIYKKGDYADVDTPDLILLDINLPKLNGFEVLKTLKYNSTFCVIPVIMLTTSSSEIDIRNAYKNYANCYIIKPNNADELVNTVQAIENFWIGISQLPNV
ncbi:MAG: response regulator [Balneolaceae bacterium]|nr:MAG: response regulator [Balneolaceae bacterium]